MIVMLATDLCRAILRQQPAPLLARLQEWSASGEEIVISAISYAELIAAALLTAERDRHMTLVEALCARLDSIAPWDSGAVDAYTRLQRQLMLEQRTLNMNDVMIAAHALSLGATLLTGSGKSFAGLKQLELQSWNND